MQVQYKFSDKDMKQLLNNNIVIVTDTREQRNEHIIKFFEKKKIQYIVEKLEAGDYGVKLLASPELGIMKDCYLPIMIEKKNSIDELASSITDRVRFSDEFLRAVKGNIKIHMLVEQAKGYGDILNNNYRSQYGSKALMASLKSFEARFNFTTTFLERELSGDWIYRTLFYFTREYLKN